MSAVFPKVPLEFGEDGDRSQKILKEADYIARTQGRRSFPWRYFVISRQDRDILANEMTYVLGSRDIVAGTDYDIMTPDSPIGKAIEGAKVGDVVSYTAPNGRELSVTVKAAKPLA